MERDQDYRSASKRIDLTREEEEREKRGTPASFPPMLAPKVSREEARRRIQELDREATSVAKQFVYGVLQGMGSAAEAVEYILPNPLLLLNYAGIDTPNQWVNKKIQKLEAPISRAERISNTIGQFAPDLFGGIRAARVVRSIADERNIARAKELVPYLQQKYNMTEKTAKGWAAPDPGIGHHSPIPRRVGRDYKIPKKIMDSCFNVVHPEGISRFDMAVDHYGLDDYLHGGRLPNAMGRGWSGRKMGFERYGRGKRLWKGTPNCTKYAAGIGGLLFLDSMLDNDD